MADSPEETDSLTTDDGQLTIRIPNPKVFMARKSQWIGRRGKPRCDHCRSNNLKCDRVLPACNHCAWSSERECKYTPLPTPAHRGIPRCDRCRSKNLKCDRNLPVCNHCSGDEETECNYTPKKRHKVPTDKIIKDQQISSYGAKAASFLISEVASMGDQDADIPVGNGEPSEQRHSFYGQNVASTPSHPPHASNSYDRDGSSESDVSRYDQSGRFAQAYNDSVWPKNSPRPPVAPKHSHKNNQISFISHSFTQDNGSILNKSRIEPWTHPAFAPLPEAVHSRISALNPMEMPSRNAFDERLSAFLAELGPELRETAALSPDVYVAASRYISRGDTSSISDRIKMWITLHHVCSGSNKYNVLLMPRDAYFDIEEEEEERLRAEYIACMDGQLNTGYTDQAQASARSRDGDHGEHDLNTSDGTKAFERLPVQTQIYDILVYAHRAHLSSSFMIFEIRTLGMAAVTWPMAEIFVRLCPFCCLRAKSTGSYGVKPEATSSRSKR